MLFVCLTLLSIIHFAHAFVDCPHYEDSFSSCLVHGYDGLDQALTFDSTRDAPHFTIGDFITLTSDEAIAFDVKFNSDEFFPLLEIAESSSLNPNGNSMTLVKEATELCIYKNGRRSQSRCSTASFGSTGKWRTVYVTGFGSPELTVVVHYGNSDTNPQTFTIKNVNPVFVGTGGTVDIRIGSVHVNQWGEAPEVDNVRLYSGMPEECIREQESNEEFRSVGRKGLKFLVHFNGDSFTPRNWRYCPIDIEGDLYVEDSEYPTDLVLSTVAGLFFTEMEESKKRSTEGTKKCHIYGDPHVSTFHEGSESSARKIHFGQKHSKAAEGTYLVADCVPSGASADAIDVYQTTKAYEWIPYSVAVETSVLWRGSIFQIQTSRATLDYANGNFKSRKDSGGLTTKINGVQITITGTSKTSQEMNNLLPGGAEVLNNPSGKSSVSISNLLVVEVTKVNVYTDVWIKMKNKCASYTWSRRSMCERTNAGNDEVFHDGKLQGDEQISQSKCIYSPWTPCTRDCGGGKRTRFRVRGSLDANGGCGVKEEQSCNSHSCACTPSEWSSCEGGKRFRTYPLSQAGSCAGISGSCSIKYGKMRCTENCGATCKYEAPSKDKCRYKLPEYDAPDAPQRRVFDAYYGLDTPANTVCGAAVMVLGLIDGSDWKNCHPYAIKECHDQYALPSCDSCNAGMYDQLGCSIKENGKNSCGPGNKMILKPKPHVDCGDKAGWTAEKDGLFSTISGACPLECDLFGASSTCLSENQCDRDSTTCKNTVCKSIDCRTTSNKLSQNGGYSCDCKSGYRRRSDSKCVDIDECAEGTHQCHAKATCRNTPGSYTCTCVEHWEGSGKHCEPICDFGAWLPCTGECGGLRQKIRSYVNPAVKDEEKCVRGFTASCPKQKCAPITPFECKWSDNKFKKRAEQACSCAMKHQVDDCLMDICGSGDVASASLYCDLKIDDCIADLVRQAAANPKSSKKVSSCAGVNPSGCGGYPENKEFPGTCKCDGDAVTGNRCSYPKTYFRGHVSFSGTTLEVKPVYTPTQASVESHMADNKFAEVSESVVLYTQVLSKKNGQEDVKTNLIATFGDCEVDSSAGSVELEIKTTSKKRAALDIVLPTQKEQRATITQSGSIIKVSWTAGERSRPISFAIKGTNSAQLSIKIVKATGVKQVLYGSSSGLPASNDVIDVVPVPYTVNGNEIRTGVIMTSSTQDVDECSKHVYNCTSCMADPKCGYCRDNEECRVGTHSGPWRGVCSEWRFTDANDVSRRVTVSLGFPVAQEEMDVFLSDAPQRDHDTELPVTISINTQPASSVIFDILMLIPGRHKRVGEAVHAQIENIIQSLQGLSQVKVSIIEYYKSGSTVQLNNMLLWGRENSNKADYFNGYVKGEIVQFTEKTLALATTTIDVHNYVSPMQTLVNAATSSVNYNFRKNSRRVVFLYVGQRINWATENRNFEENKQKLLSDETVNNFFPVFYTLDAEVEKDYIELVNRLGFGRAARIGGSPRTDLEWVTSSISLVLRDDGHVDKSKIVTNHVTGLKEGQRALFQYTLHSSEGTGKKSFMVSPGYGHATVEQVSKQQPQCSNEVVSYNEDALYKKHRGKLIKLSADQEKSLKKDIANGVVLYYITANPSKGKLYQWSGSKPGPEIIVNGSAVLVHSKANKVFYVPDEHEHSAPKDGKWTPTQVYTSFKYAIGNLCSLSDSCTYDVKIKPTPDAPTAFPFNLTMKEDEITSFDISEKFFDPDYSANLVKDIPQWRLSENLENRFRKDNKVAKAGVETTFAYPTGKVFSVHPLQDENGERKIYWDTQDVNDKSLKTQGFFTLVIEPVNDAPTISKSDILTVQEDTKTPFKVHGRDIDSGSFSFELDVPADFKGSLATWDHKPVPKGQINKFVVPKTVPMQKHLDYTGVFYFKGEHNAFSCDLVSNHVTDKKECDPKTDIYTQFSLRTVDKEGLTSSTTVIKFIVANVNDAPEVPHHPISKSLKEEGDVVVELEGKDVDGEKFDAFLMSWTEGIEIYQFPKTDGLVAKEGKNKGLISDPKHRVVLQGLKDVYGNPRDNFHIEPFTYKLFDGRLWSQEKDVNVIIYPVNDAPVPATKDINTMEDTPTIITVRVDDTDNEMRDLDFRLVSQLPVSLGAFYRFDRRYDNYLGPLMKEGERIRVQNCAVVDSKGKKMPRDVGACVVFVPALHNFTGPTDKAIELSYTATDKPQFGFPGQSFTVSQTVKITISPVNDAPRAEIVDKAVEDTLSVIQLKHFDVENDPVDILIHDVPSEGKLYQYKEGFDASSVEGLVEITKQAGGVYLSDHQKRVLYKGPQHKHSDSLLDHHTYTPKLSYTVEEQSSATAPTLSSVAKTTSFSITAVNDAPEVFDDSWAKDTTVCYSDCTFDEDFGVTYPGVGSESRSIFFGGFDQEHDELKVVVQSIDCEKPTSFFINNGRNNLEPFELEGSPKTIPKPFKSYPASLHPLLEFRPSADASDYKCTLVYKVNDGKVDSLNSKTITINIKPVNDAPRAKDAEKRVWLDEDTEKIIDPKIFDIEGDDFVVSIHSCASIYHGQFFYQSGSEWKAVECAHIADKQDPIHTFGKGESQLIKFVPAPGAFGDDYNSITLLMKDSVGDDAFHTISVDVLPINDAPVIYIGDKDAKEKKYEQHVDILHDDGGAILTKDYSFWDYFHAVDEDAGEDRILDLQISFTAGSIALDSGYVPFRKTNHSRHYRLSMKDINELMKSLAWSTDEPVSDGRMKIVLNDRGYIGQCPPDQRDEKSERCPQKATVTIALNSGYNTALIHGLVVATPVVAGAGVVAALATLAVTTSSSATASSGQYTPWLENADGADSAIFSGNN